MFNKLTKDIQLVDIVKTKTGEYLTVNFKDSEYPHSPAFYKEPFRIKGKKSLIEAVNTIAKKNPKYKLKCRFETPTGKSYHIKDSNNLGLQLEDYIIELDSLVNDEFLNYKKSTPNSFDSDDVVYNQIKDWYYAETFQQLIRKTTKNDLETELLPSDVLLNVGARKLSVIGTGMNNLGGYASARVDLYELTKIMPRKKILNISTYIAKKTNSGFISRISSDSEMSSRKIIEEMEEEGRLVKVRGFPAIITFDSELNNIDPQILNIRANKKSEDY